MKQLIKNILAKIDYFLYQVGIKKCNIKVHTIDETIEELIRTNKSMVRFGDGEITMIGGRSLQLQQMRPDIAEGLKRILGYEYDELIVTIPEIFEELSMHNKNSKQFWKEHLLFYRRIYEASCNPIKQYYSTFVSRFYYFLDDKSPSTQWASNIKKIWKDKDIVIVEGQKTHNGVGNDLFDTARSVVRIIGPASNAYDKLEEIFLCCKQYPKDRLFLLSLGVAAKFLAEKLFLSGYRVLDIGNLDLEYEWYLHKEKKKTALFKHSVVGVEANRKAGYQEYLEQIKKEVY